MHSGGRPNPDLRIAHLLADAADSVSLRYFRTSGSRLGPDEPDLAVDKAVMAALLLLAPQDGFLSEEAGSRSSDSSRCWILDPIDGSTRFRVGNPEWSTELALTRDGAGEVGVISSPAIGSRWSWARDAGSWQASVERPTRPTKRLCVSPTSQLRSARVSLWLPRDRHQAAALLSVLEGSGCRLIVKGQSPPSGAVSTPDGYPNDAVRVAAGMLDAFILPRGGVWDYAASGGLCVQAGGAFSDWSGKTVLAEGSGLFSNGVLHESIIEILAHAA